MRPCIALSIAIVLVGSTASAQAPGKWPPDSLVNLRVLTRTMSPTAVWGQMRNIAAALGVECTYCHVGAQDAALADIDYIADTKRTKLVAREMLRLVNAVNARLDSLPSRGTPAIAVTCRTCHRGVPRPVPLATIIADAALAADADSAIRAYRTLRERYYGRDAYDFGETSLNSGAFRVARSGRIADALALLRFNESLFPDATALHVIRGNVHLMAGDTSAAAASFREAIRKDAGNDEARSRLRDIGRPPSR